MTTIKNEKPQCVIASAVTSQKKKQQRCQICEVRRNDTGVTSVNEYVREGDVPILRSKVRRGAEERKADQSNGRSDRQWSNVPQQ